MKTQKGTAAKAGRHHAPDPTNKFQAGMSQETFNRVYKIRSSYTANATSLIDFLETAKGQPGDREGEIRLPVFISLSIENWHFVAQAMARRRLSADELISELLGRGDEIIEVAGGRASWVKKAGRS